MRIALHNGWTVRAVGGEIPPDVAGVVVPASVPGCVHLDLLAAGLIPDPYLDENEAEVQWIGRVDWRYETTFDWPGGGDAVVDLVALGLDTIATVAVNSTVVARTQNMHRSYRFPVSGLVRVGRNELGVTFRAGITVAEEMRDELGPRPHVNSHPFNAIRKMACNFGWDWGPDLVTAGIWRPIKVESWSAARIAGVRPVVEVDGSTGRLRAHVDVQRAPADATPLTVRVDVAGVSAHAHLAGDASTAVVELAVPEVKLWWPHGYGDQPLYPVTVVLSDPAGDRDRWERRIGFRTSSLETTPDADGTPFTLSVNGRPLFARGANWIPDDCFPSRVTRSRYEQRLRQARDVNVNLIRVWGGGIYETDDFYDLCDELGLLVWQDFLFACAAYAEEEPIRDEVVAEAREAVTRLSSHPSLALWNGCNENIWGHEDWDWKPMLGDRTWGWRYYTEILPAIVAELDPGRPYSPGSPYSMTPSRHPNDPEHGTMHIWDVWNQLDYTAYRNYRPRFVTEFGFQGPPTWATLARSVHDMPLAADSPAILSHQKAEDGNGKLARGLGGHLPEPRTIDDWHWATSLNQARAVAFGIEHFRSWQPRCMGAVIWQLNDCWPVTSWAAIDGDGRRKPVWYAVRRSFRDRLLTIQPRDDSLALIAVNDTDDQWREVVQVSRCAFDGTVLATAVVTVGVPPRGTVTEALGDEITVADDPAAQFILADSSTTRAYWPFVEDVAAALPPAELDVDVARGDGGYDVTVVARTFVRDLALLADRVAPDAEVDDMLVTLLPGERVRFHVTTEADLDPAALTDAIVLRSANQLVTSSTALPVSS